MVRKIFWVIVPFHLIFAIWIFGNPDLFVEDSQFILNNDKIDNAKDTTQTQFFDRFQSESYIQEFGKRALKPQNYIHLALLILIVVIYILMIFE